MKEPLGHRRRLSSQSLLKRFLHLLQALAAAAFGVQSQRNLQRDFSSRSPMKFIIGGAVFTLLLIASILLAVNLVLDAA